MAAVNIETDGLAKKMEQVDLKERVPCILVLGMAGSGKSSFVQVCSCYIYCKLSDYLTYKRFGVQTPVSEKIFRSLITRIY